jgi:hypothetical protein
LSVCSWAIRAIEDGEGKQIAASKTRMYIGEPSKTTGVTKGQTKNHIKAWSPIYDEGMRMSEHSRGSKKKGQVLLIYAWSVADIPVFGLADLLME